MILAIDPGPSKSAWVLYDTSLLKNHSPIIKMGIEENNKLIHIFTKAEISSIVDQVVIEMVASYGMPVGASVFETCVTIGRFIQLFSNLPVSMMYRKDIKMHLCQSMRAKDGNIRQALIDRLGPQGTKKNPGPTYGLSKDLWAALAVAVVFADTWKEEVCK